MFFLKQNAEPEALAIPENKTINSMKFKIVISLLLVSMLLSFSAEAQKRRKKDKDNNKPLTEKQRYESADLFAQAVIARETDDLEKALRLFTEVMNVNPDDPAANYERARILSAMGRNDEALEYAKNAVVLNPDNIWYKASYGKICRANEDYDEYVKAYEDVVAQEPNNLNFVYELAFAYQFTGDYENAITAFKKLEELAGKNEQLTSQIATFYVKTGDPEKGLEEYESLIESNPDEPRYYAMLAEFCTKNNMPDKAFEAYKKIVELNPDDPYVHISLADYYSKNGDPENAFNEFKLGFVNPSLGLETKINLMVSFYKGELSEQQKREALELSKILRDVHGDDAMSSAFYASMLYENGEYEEAEKLFRKIVDSDQASYLVWEQLLFCQWNLKNYKQLAVDSEDCIDLFPNYPLPYYFAGISNFQLKDYVKAKAYLESGKDFVVNNNNLLEQFYSSLGDIYNELGNYDASYKAYEKVLRLNPDNSFVLNNYAYYLSLRKSNLDKAEQMAKKSVGLDPYNSNNLDTYAWVLFQLGKYDDALTWIKKAYNNSDAKSGVVLEHYGDILYKTGNHEEAVEKWKQAAEADEHSELLEKKIKDKKLYE